MKSVDRPAFLDTPEFKAWETRANNARQAMLNGKTPPDRFTESIWQDFKNQFLIPLGRCAYCEGRYAGGSDCDAEHYRPKGKVTQGRKDVAHPGYFWLAYEWHNLLLACRWCNAKHTNRDDADPRKKTSHDGKLCEFPILGARITGPSADPRRWIDELLAEEPQLLHPYFDSPSEHFEAQFDGMLYHRTERGRVTIEVCDLNRKRLRNDRRSAEQIVKTKVSQLFGAQGTGVDWTRDCFGPDMAFSTYLNCKVREELNRPGRHAKEDRQVWPELRRRSVTAMCTASSVRLRTKNPHTTVSNVPKPNRFLRR